MAINPSYKVTVSKRDLSGEIGKYSFGVLSDDSLTADITDLPAVVALRAAINDIADGVDVSVTYNEARNLSNVKIGTGQREDKYLVIYEDVTTLQPYDMEIPCRNNSFDTMPGTDLFDLTVTEFADFVTAFEAIARSPDGNAVNVLAIRLIGQRN